MRNLSAFFTALWQAATDWTRKPADRGIDTGAPAGRNITAGPLAISPESVDLIVRFEVGSRAHYDTSLQRPTWPGAASGVTIGFGYDVGYNSPAQIRADWKDSLTGKQLDDLVRAAGVKGEKARPLAKGLSHITVPWDKAKAVFESRTLPRFAKQAAETFPGLAGCHPHVQGVLLSIIFNRGTSLSGDRRREMRAIREHVAAGRIGRIPAEIRSMKRLWAGQGLDGLLRRREAEAALIESIL